MTQISSAKPASGQVIGGIVMLVIGVILLFNSLPALFSNLASLAQWATMYGLEYAFEMTMPYFILPIVLLIAGFVLIRVGWRMLRKGGAASRTWATQQAQQAGRGIEQRVSQAQRGGASAVQGQASRAGQLLDQRAPGWRQSAGQLAGAPNAAWAQQRQQPQRPPQQQRRQPPPPSPGQLQQPGQLPPAGQRQQAGQMPQPGQRQRAPQRGQQVAQSAAQVVQAAQSAVASVDVPAGARRPRVQQIVPQARGSVLTSSSLTTAALTSTSLSLNSLVS